MSRQNDNGSRRYLADEVNAQRVEITALRGKLNDVVVKVERIDVILSQLIESDRRASAGRQAIYAKLEEASKGIAAARAETAQVMQSIVGTQTDLASVKKTQADQAKTLEEINGERNQVKGAASLARSISGAGWGIVGLIGGAMLTLAGVVAAWFKMSSPHPGGGP